MRSWIKSAAPFAAKVLAVCAAALFGVSCPLSCAMDDGTVKIVANSCDSPTLEGVSVTSARTIVLTFSKSVEPVSAYIAESVDGLLSAADCAQGGGTLTITSANDLDIGKRYVLGGKVRDGGGNTLTFALPILGYNSNPAGVVICAVHPKYEKDSKSQNYKDEFIQLYVTHAGNLSGFTLQSGKLGASSLVLPTVEVQKGEIVTVHLQALEAGCNDELGGAKNTASSRYSSPAVRDVWASAVDYTQSTESAWVKNTATNCLGESDETILLSNGGEVLDAVFYAVQGTDEWKSEASYDLAEMAVEAGLCQSTSPSAAIAIGKAMTAASILKRNGCAALSGGAVQDNGSWVKASFAKNIEQKVLAQLDASLPAGDGEAGSTPAGGGTSSGESGGSGSRPALALPPPACAGIEPRVVICSVHPAYTSATDEYGNKVYKVEFIQLYVLSGGNLSHLTVSTGKLGADNFYPLPDAPVEAGDIVTVHLRRVGDGCVNETDAREIYLADSWYSCDELRDVWIDNVYDPAAKNRAAALDRSADAVAVFSGAEKTMMDAVLYSVAGTAEWKTAGAKEIARKAVQAHLWQSAEPSDCITVDSKFTPAVIMQRNGVRSLLSAAKKGSLPSTIAQDAGGWRKKPFGKAVEQELLTFVD